MPVAGSKQAKLDRCWSLPRVPPLFIQLGRTGDLLLLFPAFKLIHERTGNKPVVLVSNEYSNVFDGISYAIPWVFQGHWYSDMPKARALAERVYGSDYALIPHWWSPGVNPTNIPLGPMVLQCHGHGWGCSPERYPDFGTSMWLRAGLTRQEMIETPLVFDRRDKDREEALFKMHVHDTRPLLLYNFTGISSPFGYVPEMMHLLRPYRGFFNMLDLGAIRAHRIYDLLVFYDRAVGLITTDTATCHLAPASNVPTLWLTVPGWGKSVPRGNVALHVQYDEVPRCLGEIEMLIQDWQERAPQSSPSQTPALVLA